MSKTLIPTNPVLIVDDDEDLQREFRVVRDALTDMDRPHLNEFLAAWPE